MLTSKTQVSARRVPNLVRLLATHTSNTAAPATRHTWEKQEIQKIYDTPLLDLVFRAASVHRQYHDPGKVQLCTLMNIKSTSIALIYRVHILIYDHFQLADVLKIVRN